MPFIFNFLLLFVKFVLIGCRSVTEYCGRPSVFKLHYIYKKDKKKNFILKCKIRQEIQSKLEGTTEKHHTHTQIGGFSLSHNIHINSNGMLPLVFYTSYVILVHNQEFFKLSKHTRGLRINKSYLSHFLHV